ncbi:MAG: hypothetical protein P8Y85_01480 [Nitrospirota bacterium]|jgi:hypothetical protein
MHTLFDFITHVKTVEYLIAISTIAVFILFLEVLKPHPFRGLVEAGRDDIEHVRNSGGFASVAKTMGKVAAAPLVGLLYIVGLPFAFLFAIGYAAVSGLVRAMGISPTLQWRPQEAYLAGKKDKKGAQKDKKDQAEKKKD